jgi:hypothetical protein
VAALTCIDVHQGYIAYVRAKIQKKIWARPSWLGPPTPNQNRKKRPAPGFARRGDEDLESARKSTLSQMLPPPHPHTTHHKARPQQNRQKEDSPFSSALHRSHHAQLNSPRTSRPPSTLTTRDSPQRKAMLSSCSPAKVASSRNFASAWGLAALPVPTR